MLATPSAVNRYRAGMNTASSAQYVRTYVRAGT